MGAKRGRTKGNEQKAEYENLEGRHERSGRRERGSRGSESGDGNCGSHCEAEAGMAERKKQRLSSEMLKRKRTKESGSQALIPEENSKREAPVERLWERNWEGRKETNSRAEYENRERRHERSGREERGKPGSESGEAHRGSHCEAEAGRAERKKQRLSSEMLKRKQTKESGSQALIPEERSKREAPVEQLWERSREGRKETNSKPSTRTGSKAWETRPGRTGETVEA